MSLLTDAMEEFIFLNKQKVPDGYGGVTTTWTEGAPIMAAAVFDTSLQARVAGVQGVTSLYTITTQKNIILEYHDVLRRTRDGKILRVTSDGTDNKTPDSAALNMRQVTAEEYDINNG